VLLPTDGSKTAEAAARFAVDIATCEQRKILVLGVAERAVFDHTEDEAVTAAIHDYVEGVVNAEVEKIRAAGVDAEGLVVDAVSVEDTILDVAESRGASLIVMGTHGRTGLARAVIGSVADRVLRRSPVPVVLVPLKAED
jgi:nucleotide-binding universal stress UspA family protein